MKDKVVRPKGAGTPPGQDYKRNNVSSNIPHTTDSSPHFSLSRFVHNRLLKIALSLGIPEQILAESAVTKWVLFNWDSKDDKPLWRKR